MKRVKSLLATNNTNKINWAIDRMQQMFPNSLLVWKYKIHKNLETQNFSQAFRLLNNLMASYPHQIDYRVYAAFAAIKEGNIEDAIQILDKAIELGYDNDVDVVYLLALAEVELFRLTSDPEIGQQADTLIEQASQLLNFMGHPTSELNLLRAQINDLLDHDLNTKDENENKDVVPRCWLLRLSDVNYHELRTGDEEDLKYINRPIGPQPQPGDVCFFVGDDYRNSSKNVDDMRWRIGAVYTVVSHPQWNPLHKYESTLKLVSRPQTSIAIDVHVVDHFHQVSESTLFELDAAALDSIVETIQFYKDGLDKEFNNVLDNLTYLEKSS